MSTEAPHNFDASKFIGETQPPEEQARLQLISRNLETDKARLNKSKPGHMGRTVGSTLGLIAGVISVNVLPLIDPNPHRKIVYQTTGAGLAVQLAGAGALFDYVAHATFRRSWNSVIPPKEAELRNGVWEALPEEIRQSIIAEIPPVIVK